MALAYRAGWTNATQAQNLSIATSTLAHDILVAYGADDDVGRTFTWPSGFTQQAAQTTSTHDGSDLGVALKADASGSEGSQTITISSNSIIGGIAAYSGGDNTTPLDVAVVQGNATAGTTSDVTVTPVTDGAMIVVVIDGDPDGSVNTTFGVSTVSGSTGAWTQRADLNSGFRNVALYDSLQATAGAVTLRISTTGGTNNDRSWAVLVLRPAAGAGGADFSATGTGGLSLAGAATTAYTKQFTASPVGGLVLAGAAAATRSANFAQAGAGGLAFGGAAGAVIGLAAVGAGGFAFGGAAPAQASANFSAVATGGLAYAGAAAAQASANYAAAAAGGLAFAGAAATVADVGFSITGSGGIALAGAAAAAFTRAFAAAGAGGLAFAGAASASFAPATADYAHMASGGLGFAGDAPAQRTASYAYVPAGGLALGGSAIVVLAAGQPLVRAAITPTRPNAQTIARPATTAAARPANLSRGIRK